MKSLWVLCLCLPALAADLVPNRYMVQLSTEPVGAHLARTAPRSSAPGLLRSTAAESQRTLVRAEQAAARKRIETAQGKVLGSLETVGNVLIVEIAEANAQALSSIPGAKVYPVRTFRPFLDHALPLHRVPQAWSQVGINNAGAGIRVGLIDTGIDVGHPGFADAGFTAPAGFPIADSKADLAYTNNKVIVARSYARFFPTTDPDVSAADHLGHGTATAMVAGGVSNAGPLATISGVAPQAWLGSYKVFGTPGYNDTASSDVILLAIEDAVNDGMDILNLSLGGTAYRLDSDLEAQLLDTAESMGVIVVAAAGNTGPDPYTMTSPADAPLVIAAGASVNDRFFADAVVLPDNSSLVAIPGNGVYPNSPITGPMIDAATLDGNGQACASLPAGSLSGDVVLIFRGNCPFETKIDNAQAAGALAVVVYDNNTSEAPLTMGVGAATLPAVFVSNADGVSLKGKLAGTLAVTVQFVPSPFYTDPANLAPFSARGPNIDFTTKPDLLAVGQNIYTAAEKLDANGVIYDPGGYAVENGTSFSAPLVAGAAAIVKQARPGLSADQYRSLLINSAAPASLTPGTAAGIQQGGAGVLDVLAALNAPLAASPVSLAFGAGGTSINSTLNLTLTNVSTVSDTFQVAVVPAASGPAPSVSTAGVALDPGASVTLPVAFQADSLSPGAYEGFLTIQGVNSGSTTRVPYWYGVPSGVPAHITVLNSTTSGAAGSRITNAIMFRVTDAIGLPVTGVEPTVSPVTSGAQSGTLSSVTSIPNAYVTTVRLSPQAGNNVYQIQAGDISTTVTIVGR